ncbi:hypothetical protein H6G20_06405 [Desertifilum sp. FACHB-1129]|uniref:Uncharacterized protein n=1 Tax=Desertifilum tharense IPPAS B-1220 TaxID=1781255 RepID=A0ACD5H3U4_9CYAN|nr:MULTISPECIES: hypothetical protein [Desertifilum]MBD2311287.1 hypothetical protein [Desertifilum sp. FACHB-1129]MBD2321533.1 hypothetical protein [Desertifilum sp. FACHB-866]MBD2331660.1 hypothetical protein [Desertifilum sp. FACHB-868]MDA0213678.1 hypothetical protein [Cyanobacteria bacterium FC1]
MPNLKPPLHMGNLKWTATRVDPIFGSNLNLARSRQVYGYVDSQQKFVNANLRQL